MAVQSATSRRLREHPGVGGQRPPLASRVDVRCYRSLPCIYLWKWLSNTPELSEPPRGVSPKDAALDGTSMRRTGFRDQALARSSSHRANRQ